MLGLKTKIIAISAAVALIAAQAVAVWSASRKIDRLQTELQSQRAATQSAQTALAVESARYQSYRQAAEQSAAALQSAAVANQAAAATLQAAIAKNPQWSAAELPTDIREAVK